MVDRSKKGRQAKDKGKRGERLLAAELREYGYPCRRGVQYNGGDGSADVIGLPGVHIECKFVEDLDINKAMLQSIDDSKDHELPVVMHKRSRRPWLVTMQGWDNKMLSEDDFHSLSYLLYQGGLVTLLLSDWIRLYRRWAGGGGEG